MSKLDRANFWIENGFTLLPCQPQTKMLVSGFGQYKAKIKDHKNINVWWGKSGGANLAVIAPDDFYILDFDSIAVYALWVDKCPTPAASYTEHTPRGGRHVFLRGTPPQGIKLVSGVELKKVVLVAPSSLGPNYDYKVQIENDFILADPVDTLFSLSQPGHATPYALRASQARKPLVNPMSHIEQIKSHFTISHVLKTYRPQIAIGGRGDFQSCACPFHKDNKPSFWFSDSKGLWGCHACNVRGDVINLYARFEAVNVREAISRMWAVMA